MVKNRPCNAGDLCSTPGQVTRPHMLLSTKPEPQLGACAAHLENLCAATKTPNDTVKVPCTMKKTHTAK